LRLPSSLAFGTVVARMSTRPTIADIAKEIGVSPSTVSRALRDHPAISEVRKIEVRAAAEAIGFAVPEKVVDQKAEHPKLVGCVVPSVSHPYFVQLIEKLEAVCAQNGCDLILHNSGGSLATEKMIVQRLISRKVDGVFFVPQSADATALEECTRSLKTVVITQQTDLCPSIGVSHEEGGRQVAEHFKEIGRRSCLWIGYPGDTKLQGFLNYIEAQRLTDFKVETLPVFGWDECFIMEVHNTILRRYTVQTIRSFDCVFGVSDLAAVGVLHALKDLRRAVPQEVAVCGFDDTSLAREVWPGLTSVAQPIGQIVRSGFDLLERIIHGESISPEERTFSLKPHLVVRGSTFAGP